VFLRHAPAHALLPVAFAALGIVASAGCTAPTARAPIAQVPPSAIPVSAPAPTPVPTPTPVPAPVLEPDATPTPAPNEGDVDGATGYPQLTIELVGEDAVQATIEDPRAKAWRLVIQGPGELAGDRLELLVDTGDVEPAITATEVRGGIAVSTTNLAGVADGSASAGACHATLHACVDAAGLKLPNLGDGTLSVRLDLPDPSVPLDITAGTATWPGEPFVLGPWTDAETFPWGDR
jgi:hypothetical protein